MRGCQANGPRLFAFARSLALLGRKRLDYGISFRQTDDQSPRGRPAAQELAADRGNPQIEPLHLLAALAAESDGIVRPMLEKIGANRAQLERIVDAELGHLPKSSGGAARNRAEQLIEGARCGPGRSRRR